MIKVHHPEIDQEELIKAAGQIVTLIEDEQHVKQASSSCITEDLIRGNRPDEDHFMVHLIAMGDGETYGQNRNGDFWPKEANQKYHDTFVKKGHFFREHNNRDPKKAIGIVKASAYNPEMDRIELVIHGNKDTAEEEYGLAKEGKALSFSMSARVPYDICNVCDNKATKSANYCEHLKHRMNEYIPEFQKFAYAINDKPTFFDISRVANPADRIAHYIDYAFNDELQKAASAPALIFSDELAAAQGVSIPENVGFVTDSSKQKILEKLAAAEQYMEDVRLGRDLPQDEKYNFVKYASANIFEEGELTDQELDQLRSVEPGTLFYKLASASMILPFKSFVAYSTGRKIADVEADPIVKYANSCGCMGTSMRDIMSSVIPSGLTNMFDSSSRFLADSDLGSTDEVQQFMEKADDKFSHKTGKPGLNKIIKITISSGPKMDIKSASDENLSEHDKLYAHTLAQSYGLYKVSFMKDCNKRHRDFKVDDMNSLLLTCRNT
jgi:hypothetical protein